MRTGNRFIEINVANSGRKCFINTHLVAYIAPDNKGNAVFFIHEGDRLAKIYAEESYEEVIGAIIGAYKSSSSEWKPLESLGKASEYYEQGMISSD